MPIPHSATAALRRDAPKLGLLIGAMLAFMAWATFQMPPSTTVRVVGWGLAALAVGVLAVSLVVLIRQGRQRRRAGDPSATGRSGLIALLVTCLVVAWVLAMLPTQGAWSWLATGGTLLAVLAAIYTGLRLARGGTSSLLRQARLLYQGGDHTQALKRLDALDVERPDDPAGLQLRVAILRDSGRFGPAHKAAQRLIAAHPELYHGYAEDGLTYMEEKRPTLACEPFGQGVDVAPDLGEAHYNLGLAQSEAKRPTEAIDSLERALSLGLIDEIDTLVGWYRLYRAYKSAHRYEDATSALKKIGRMKGVMRRWRLALVDGGDACLLGEIEGLAKE